MKGTGAKRNVCPGSCVSTGAKFPVAPVESAPMVTQGSGASCIISCIVIRIPELLFVKIFSLFAHCPTMEYVARKSAISQQCQCFYIASKFNARVVVFNVLF